MNARMATGGALLAGLIAGFAVGRLSNSGIVPSSAGNPGHRPSLTSASVSSVDSTELSDPKAETKARRQDRPPSVPRVSLPLAVVVESLRNQQFRTSGFEGVIYRLPDALTLLGVRADEQETVIGVMKDIQKRILAEEKQHVKVSKVTKTELTLDQSGMLEPMKQIVADAQEGIRANLPQDLAGALIGAINWEEFYTGGPQAPVTTFRIERTPRGVFAQRKYQGGGTGMMLDPGRFPDDGTPISIREVYPDDRWAPFLGDHKLLPVDDM